MKHVLLITLIICLPCFSIGQTIPVDSFYVPGTSWTEVTKTVLRPCSAGSDHFANGIEYKIERDTLISGVVYHLLSLCNKGYYGYSINCSSGEEIFLADHSSCISPAPIFAMLRTNNNRVYFTLLATQAPDFSDCDSVGVEYLLYDFNLAIGTTVTPGTPSTGGLTVSAIDSVSLSNGTNVARYNSQLVYGVGSKNGFIKYWSLYVCGPGPDVEDQYLLCYDNPHFSYHFSFPPGTLSGNLQNNCFDIGLYLGVPEAATSVLSLYPNPATNVLTITAADPITLISITNLVGQTLYTHACNSAKIQVDISDMAAGVYFVKINGTEVRKFVKE
jgi:hypothetical protein